MTRHTPGPWFVDVIGRNTIGSIETESGDCVAQAMQMLPRDADLTQEHRKANARLIAAAPELLEALKDARDIIAAAKFEDDDGEGSELRAWLKKIDAAITKAEFPA